MRKPSKPKPINFSLKFKGWEFYIYKWHSINLIPNFGRVSVCDDGESGYKVFACWLSMTVFGLVFNIQYPTTKQYLFLHTPCVGPHWSRQDREWYRPSTQAERDQLYGKYEGRNGQ